MPANISAPLAGSGTPISVPVAVPDVIVRELYGLHPMKQVSAVSSPVRAGTVPGAPGGRSVNSAYTM